MKKILLVLSVLFFVVVSALAKTRTQQEMMQVARSILSQTHGKKLIRATTVPQLDIIKQSSQLTIIGGKGGFSVIANDDRIPAVLGYSDKEYIDSQISPAFLWWLNTINEQIENNLAQGTVTEVVLPDQKRFASNVDALLVTEWGQNAPYYNQTPTYTSGKSEVHYVTGCVATAMAQIMYYHRWPEKGKGYVSYYFTPEGSTNSQKLSVNLASSPYEWNNMLPVYKGVSYSDAQANAVSMLMMHCGYSVNMQNTRTGSGAFTSDAADALRKRFYYNENMHFYRRDFFPVKEWMEKIFNELNDGYPILYGAQRSDGGHEFVLDGYDENGLVHVNWGWDGNQNGYFDIASLNGYTTGQEMVLVRKNDLIIPYSSYWGMNGNLQITEPTPQILNINFTAYNLDYNAFTGQVGIIANQLETNQIQILGSIETTAEYLYGGSFTIENVDISAFSKGTYRIYAATFATDKDTEWQPIRCHENLNNSYILSVYDGGYSLSAENNANWTDIKNVAIDRQQITSTRIFDLQGREVKTPQRGVYIINGKKVVK